MKNTNVIMLTATDEELPALPSMIEGMLEKIPPRKQDQEVRYGFRFDKENGIDAIAAIEDGMNILDSIAEEFVDEEDDGPACECSCTNCNNCVADMATEPEFVGCPADPSILNDYLPTVDSVIDKLVPRIKETVPEQHQKGFLMGYMTGVIDTVGYLSTTNKLK